MNPIQIGNLHLHPIDYAIKYCHELDFTYGPFYLNKQNPITKDNRILLKSIHRNNSLDLNLNTTQPDFLDWLYRLQEKPLTSENSDSIDNLIDILASHNTPTNSYVYIFHSVDGMPEYVGVKHDYSKRYSYKGSSNTYTPKSGSLVKIVAKNLTPRLGLQVENFAIEKLSQKYKLYNNTSFSNKLILTSNHIIALNLTQSDLPTIETFYIK